MLLSDLVSLARVGQGPRGVGGPELQRSVWQHFHRRWVRNTRRSSPSTKLPVHRAAEAGGKPGGRSVRCLNPSLQALKAQQSWLRAPRFTKFPEILQRHHGLEHLLKCTKTPRIFEGLYRATYVYGTL